MRDVIGNYAGTRLGLIAIALCIGGCRPQQAPQFQRSAEVQSLIEFAGEGDEEGKKLWSGLQKQIDNQLLKNCGTPMRPIVFGDPEADRTRLQRGAEVFAYRCQQCHGVAGDGQGPLAAYLNPKPRDYTKGIFKFTSTPYGAKPRRADLLRTIRRGVTGTSMPSFKDLDPADLEAVVDYVMFLSQRGELEHRLVEMATNEEEVPDEYVQEDIKAILDSWKEAQSEVVMPQIPMPAMTEETIAKGRELFLQQVCNKCHGIDGRGGLAGNIQVSPDAWGHKTAAADLTSGMYRGGGRPIDIYRRIYSGINGTPMPGFGQEFADHPENIWYLVHYVRDTGERRRRNLPPADAGQAAPPAEESAPAAETAPKAASMASDSLSILASDSVP
jgi:mono/diheme cytochrome c family protein